MLLILYSKVPVGYPAGLRIVSINSTTVTFAWNKPLFRNYITGYVYEFYLEVNVKKGTNKGINNVVVTFTGIPRQIGKGYTCGLRVAFMNPSGLGPFSPKVYAIYTLPTTKNQSRSECIHIFESFV